ncbi:dimethylsulfonioproprionate lyase family protein [Pseudahrensia aquimaris]|uniref:Dimethylsulfonioproprionate lyase family protein n=1 Tax=Pseudahrensia aquimaris TaxID=744461 RepID=A0ABW3FIF3_9HYPH
MSIKGLFGDLRDYLSMKPDDAVRDFVGDFDWNLIPRNLAPNTLPVAGQLEGAAEHSSGWEKRIVEALATNRQSLHWGQNFAATDFGQAFADNYGFIEMLGTRGAYQSGDMAGGFLVLGPMQHFPSHRQVAEELCIPLTAGSYWMRDGGAFEERKVGEVIVHDSNEPHAIETPDAPLVAIYLWRDGDLAQKPET